MKIIKKKHYDRYVTYETLTVGELKAILNKYPDDIPVMGSSEGQVWPCTEQSIQLDTLDDFEPSDILFVSED